MFFYDQINFPAYLLHMTNVYIVKDIYLSYHYFKLDDINPDFIYFLV